MSRIRILGASLVALMAGAGGASAADLYTPPSPAVVYNPAPAYSWTGGYVGGIVGYGWNSANVKSGPNLNPNGWLGGVYGGYNLQPSSNFVVGVEGDLTLNGGKDSSSGVTVENKWGGTLRARAGVAINRFLVYGTGGLAFDGLKVKIPGSSDTSTHVGWTLGAGVEAALTNKVTARLEYRYTDLGTHSYGTSPKTKVGYTSSAVLAGVGFKF